MISTKSGLKARTIKCSSELSKRRTIEKLEIERRYWQRMGIDWKVVTEHDMSIVKIRNIEWLHPASLLLDVPAENILSDIMLDAAIRFMKRRHGRINNLAFCPAAAFRSSSAYFGKKSYPGVQRRLAETKDNMGYP